MIARAVAALSVAAFFCSSPARAQTHPGLAFDQTVRSSSRRDAPGDTSTAILHFTASRGNVRIDVEGAMLGAGPLLSGNSRSEMLFADSGATITFINVDKKQYVTVNPTAMMDAARKMMEAMGGKMTVDTGATKLTLDSLGPGPLINNHPTLRYQLSTSLRMTMAMMGTNSIIENESVEQIYAATDLTDLADFSSSLNRLADIGQSVGLAPGFMERAKALQKKIRGLPVRITKVQTVTTDGRTRSITQDMEMSNIRRLEVPDTLFVIPAGYTPLAMPTPPTSRQ